MKKYKFIGAEKKIGTDEFGRPVLSLRIPDFVAGALEDRFGNTDVVSVEMSEVRKGKSLNQNNFFWHLVGEITITESGRMTEADRIDTYRNLLYGAGLKPESVSVLKEAFETFIHRLDHLRVYVITGGYFRDGNEYITADLYFGITQYDKEEMKDLIDYTLQYAEEIGLDGNYWRDKIYGDI